MKTLNSLLQPAVIGIDVLDMKNWISLIDMLIVCNDPVLNLLSITKAP
jgi:hypothetical protein